MKFKIEKLKFDIDKIENKQNEKEMFHLEIYDLLNQPDVSHHFHLTAHEFLNLKNVLSTVRVNIQNHIIES